MSWRLRDDPDALGAAAARIEEVSGIPAAHVEKDFWVTEVLRAVAEYASSEAVTVVFKGGTSLSKAHGLIMRFSEDVDLIVVTPGESKGAADRCLKAIAAAVDEALSVEGVLDQRSATKGRKRTLSYEYPGQHNSSELKRGVQLELGARGGTPRLDGSPVAVGPRVWEAGLMSSHSWGLQLWVAVFVLTALALSACGGGDSDDSDASDDESAATSSDGGGEADSGSGDSSGTINGAPASGQAVASVDGLDFAFDLPGGLDCSISDESLTYSYRIGDNEVTLGAGMNRVDGGWMGSIALTVYNPSGEQGPVAYYPAPGDAGVLDESLFTIAGESARYEGPMLKQPANDGSQPPPVDVGTGIVTATC